MSSPLQPLWRPSRERVARSRMHDYMQWLAQEKGLQFADYDALWNWSVTQVEAFWESIWQYFRVSSSAPWQRVLDSRKMPGARWFEGARLNFAEQAFRFHLEGQGSHAAIVSGSDLRGLQELSWADLREQVRRMAANLRALGLKPGDRVAAYLPNIPEAALAFLACASIGAIWSSCSPDMGAASVLDRFRQIDPKLLLAVDGYRYGGRNFDRMPVVAAMRDALPTLEHTVLLPYLDASARLDGRASLWDNLLAPTDEPMRFEQLAFDHPLWVLYSSGTTGMPKPIVHGHGGALIESLKGLGLHLDIQPDDRYLWFSTTGWIMWNSQVCGLLLGATICIYDGNPGWPDLSTLWKFAEEARLTFFGAGAAYYANCLKAGLSPRNQFSLPALRALGSTGSPLSEECYQWVYREVADDLLLACISGGTDIAAAFVGACPILPVYAGQMQCRCLGVAVHAFNDKAEPVIDEVGELVVTEPMPSMPLYFWNDAGNQRYLESYFDTFPGLWRHGDWIRITESGGAIIYGRSDTTINRHGIRMGTAEIYRVVEQFPEVLDSLVVDLEYLGKPSFMPLFLVLRDGARLDMQLEQALRAAIRSQLSARHVPDQFVVAPEVPRTLTGKKMELPVKKLLLGMPLEKVANPDAMSNPGSLTWYQHFAATRTL